MNLLNSIEYNIEVSRCMGTTSMPYPTCLQQNFTTVAFFAYSGR